LAGCLAGKSGEGQQSESYDDGSSVNHWLSPWEETYGDGKDERARFVLFRW
jgi:hypothetical protein